MKTGLLLLLTLFPNPNANVVPDDDMSTVLMESTFQIRGPSAIPNQLTCGTVFFLGRPSKSDPTKTLLVMVTAHHVLNDVVGEDAALLLRRRKTDGAFESFVFGIKIRSAGKQLWYKHPDADVAAMLVPLPSDAHLALVSTEAIADDDMVRKFELHPGDELLSLGYPYCKVANDVGFPILRSGKIASYPIVPSNR